MRSFGVTVTIPSKSDPTPEYIPVGIGTSISLVIIDDEGRANCVIGTIFQIEKRVENNRSVWAIRVENPS